MTDLTAPRGAIPELDMWQNWASRRTAGGASKSFPTDPRAMCNEPSPNQGQDNCTREKGHGGRHMAAYGPPTFAVCSAWPGTHQPVKADM